MACYIPRWYTRPKTVTHPGTNRARRALTSFMRRTPLTATPRHLRTLTTRHCSLLHASTDISRRARSSKPAAAGLPLWARAGTDQQTDTVPFHGPRFACTVRAGGADKKLEHLSRAALSIWWALHTSPCRGPCQPPALRSGGFRGVRGVRPHPPWRPSEKFMVYQFRKQ